MQTIGMLLRDLRRQRKLTQERLATRAQVTARTIRYWESDQQQPRVVELESVLKALAVTPDERAQVFAHLPDHRAVRLVMNSEPAQNIPADLPGPLAQFLALDPMPMIPLLARQAKLTSRLMQD